MLDVFGGSLRVSAEVDVAASPVSLSSFVIAPSVVGLCSDVNPDLDVFRTRGVHPQDWQRDREPIGAVEADASPAGCFEHYGEPFQVPQRGVVADAGTASKGVALDDGTRAVDQLPP
ncbi:hypothetical protein [Actinomadura mexicana]|uniref:hypothetical protein n=1 Tax=Actinomadura mexicana TaxID=134959 RepID=UPI000B772C1C|nr:hypothetical protein [Actinomadura mexicana]